MTSATRRVRRRTPPLLAAALACAAQVARAEDWQAWQEGEVQGPAGTAARPGIAWKAVYDGELDRPAAWELKPRLRWNLRPGLDFSAVYKPSGSRGAGDDWSSAHAFEFDLTPSWNFGGRGGRAQFTHRLAVVRLFQGGGEGFRYHMLPKVSWPAHWLPGQTAADIGLELVYDFDAAALVETKIAPLRLQFRAGENGSWSIGYLFNEKRSNASQPWQRFHVMAVGLGFSSAARRPAASAPD